VCSKFWGAGFPNFHILSSEAFTITPNLVKVGSIVWKCIKNKETSKRVLFIDIRRKTITGAVMAPKYVAGAGAHKCPLLGVENEAIKICKLIRFLISKYYL
jgi:hypothetical protein